MKTKLRVLLGCLAVALMCVAAGWAQSVTGTVTGTITDTSGAVVPGARVVAHNLATNVSTPSTTDADGAYRIGHLPIGRYEVIVQSSGFNKQTLPPFSLEATQTVTFNVKLVVQGSSTTVEVSSAAPILDTQDDTISSTFTANTIENFPLNNLDFSALTLYVPGATSTFGTTGTDNSGRDTYYSDSVNLNGNRAQANNYTLEGLDINETFNNEIGYSPAPAALAEVKVLTANSPADFGNVNGAGVATVLKSGTNSFHGSAYGYVQDWRFNANSWQNDNQTPAVAKNPYSRDLFGGTLGGPILRDKLFFFVDYLAAREHTGGTGFTSLLTAKMRTGDFSELLAVNGPVNGQLYDPLNNNQPYAGNQNVPILNPVAQFLIANPSLYPEPNATPAAGTVAQNNYQGRQRSYSANNQGDIKIDYDKSDKDKITGFYSMGTAYTGTTPLLAISFSGPNLYPDHLGGVTWVHTFTPLLVNKATAGFTRVVWANNFNVDSTGQFGTSGNAKVGISFPNQTIPGYSAQNMGLFAGGNNDQGGGLIDNTWTYNDTLGWEHGKHYFSIGFSALRYENNYPTANNYGYLGSLSYSGQFTEDSATGVGGYGPADFMLGRISSVSATLAAVNVGQRQWRTGFYFTDDWKLTPALTIHYGFRYELDEPWVEENNKTGNVDEVTGQLLYAHAVPAGAPPGSGLCSNRACYDWNFHQFMPQLGFAYQASNRFVVRGGYSGTSFFEGNSSNQRLTSITPFIQALNFNVGAVSPTNVPTPLTTQNAFSGSPQGSGTYNVYPKNIQPAYVGNYNLTLEYALTRLLSLQVGYVGESGQHIEDYGNLNQYRVPSNVPGILDANGNNTSAPFYNSQYIGCNSAPASAVCSNGLLVTESRAMMNYNGLQTVLRQRLSNGLEYTVNYTYSKSMTNAVGNYGLNDGGYNADPGFQNYYDSHADYGVAGSDIKHNLTGSLVYALPVGHGLRYLSGSGRLVDEALGGWKAASSFLFYSGYPETIGGGNSNVNSYGMSRANQYRPLVIHNRSRFAWFGTDPSATPCTTPGVDDGKCAFGVPATGTFGTSSNGSVRGPGYRNVDVSAFKDFRIVEEQTVGFRFDAFNVLNMPSFGDPDLSLGQLNGGPQFGFLAQNSSIRSNARSLQFSLHYNF
ncbi:MAG TPA: carboxypeptidase regulatory-like domain-containing protein [Acidobacteriaceae bacterium]|nr:carboxypeptidase regulatory-like domain-containing protein [Acidobacteriaceae bacterium]